MIARRRVSRAPARGGEVARCLVLAATAAWFLHPYFCNRQVGTGDALWYANVLGDYVTQGRAGVFPIFAGQSDFAFNGSVYPLRAAPLYQHAGGILDFLTGHRLGLFALQHLVVILAGCAGIFSAYCCLAALAPTRRWEAAGLAGLYLGCPGVLGTLFSQDLYMTWMTVPFLPVAVSASVRSFRRDDWLSSALLAGALAALWWAHAPVAFWTTSLALGWQLVRLGWHDRNRFAWRRALACAALFGLLAQYPFVSVRALQAKGLPATLAGFEDPGLMARNLAAAFPADLLPLSAGAARLSDLQLGYGLWGLALLSLATLRLVRVREMVWPLAGAGLLVFLLFPLPGNAWAYGHLPTAVQRLTYYWPMQRLYLPLCATVVTVAVVALDLLAWRGARFAAAGRIVLALACAWTLWESRQFARAGRDRTVGRDASARALRPENRLLMNHEYGLFTSLPPYFSNGTMSAESETRLLDPDTGQPLPDPGAPSLAALPARPAPGAGGDGHGGADTGRPAPPAAGAAPGEWHPLVGHVDDNPGVVKMDTGFLLQPGHRYELAVVPHDPAVAGILQLSGSTFFREYVLPASGQPLAFGAGASNSHTLPLWTTSAEAEKIILRFIPTAAPAAAADFTDFGHFAIRELRPERAPVQLLGLVPFRVVTRADRPTWLETPRMFQPGYVAQVDGAPARPEPTPRGLTAVRLPAGRHEVVLAFQGLLGLRFSYALAVTAWIFFLTVLPVQYFTRYRPGHA